VETVPELSGKEGKRGSRAKAEERQKKREFRGHDPLYENHGPEMPIIG